MTTKRHSGGTGATLSSAVARPLPGPLVARLLRLPSTVYRAGFGWVFGHRFLALSHRGRRTGRRYTTVLEVVRWRSELDEAVVVSGFGPLAQWYRNVLAGGADEIVIGRLRFRPSIRVLERAEAISVLADYERRNRLIAPVIRAVLSRLVGFRYDGSADGRAHVVETLPLVAFTPHVERSMDQAWGPRE
jgi:deazaflavin-dependent oxidoreductase (nitroreductase family)